jgi:hypothetical protein
MSKPLPTQTTFTGVAPPWSLTLLDGNFTNVWGAINDIGTYSNTLTDTGAVNALAVTPAAGITFALVAGIALDVLIANTNTSTTVTLNANATGSKTVLGNDGNGPAIGTLIAGGIYRFVYDGTVYRMQNTNQQSGSWTTTLSGPYTINPTGPLLWTRNGSQVTVVANTTIAGTATSGAFVTASGLPAAAAPSSGRNVMCTVQDNGGVFIGEAQASGTGVIVLGVIKTVTGANPQALQSVAFSGAGSTGIPSGFSITYSL